MCKCGITVLTVGIRNKSEALKKLPLRILVLDSGLEAVTHLFEDSIDVVISHWDLVDMPDGGLLRAIIAAKPNLPTIAFVKAGDQQQEILARGLGASIVLSDDISDVYLAGILCRMFDLENISEIKGVSSLFQNKECFL